MILIYTKHSTTRLQYVFQLIFNQLLGLSFEITHDLKTFQNSPLPKFTYTAHPIQNTLFFKVTGLLFEKQISRQVFDVKKHHHLPAFYFHNDDRAVLPFDIFALIFYLVSRYEEYTTTEKDEHGRFSAKQSLAYQYGFLHQPLVNEWVIELKYILKRYFPQLEFREPTYQFTPTYDIDYAWSYLNKGFLRTIGAYSKSILKGGKDLKQRLSVQLGKEEDPYFTFDYLDELHTRYELQPLYFFLVGQFGKYDKNISIQNQAFQKLIQQTAEQYEVGIHPSYQSNTDFKILKKELRSLELVTRNLIESSRQHFLKLEFPKTYQNLIKLGVKSDYSMGYASDVGFRASIAQPFYWFDLSKNETTDLWIVPFQLMDVTLKNYLKLSPEQAIIKAKQIIENTKAVNGHLITLFHNNSFCEQEGWEGWKAVYEQILEMGRID